MREREREDVIALIPRRMAKGEAYRTGVTRSYTDASSAYRTILSPEFSE